MTHNPHDQMAMLRALEQADAAYGVEPFWVRAMRSDASSHGLPPRFFVRKEDLADPGQLLNSRLGGVVNVKRPGAIVPVGGRANVPVCNTPSTAWTPDDVQRTIGTVAIMVCLIMWVASMVLGVKP